MISVKIQSNVYGAVLFHSGEEYGSVCADGFDKNAAKVVCKEKSWNTAMSLCCSAFGPSNRAFTMSDVRCTGSESSVRKCEHTVGGSCHSGQYAAVVCASSEMGFTSKYV